MTDKNILFLPLELIVLIGFSAICSGLNVALMSLKVSDLKRLEKIGNKQAKKVLTIRKNTHLVLAAILFTNVAVISATSLVLDEHLNGLIAGLLSTLLIVVFGEVMPQALFVKNALGFSSALVPVVKLMIFVTYPVSKPLQLLLDRLFGHEKNQLHSRHELSLLVGEHLNHSSSELDEDEIEIIKGALQLSEKNVELIMTPISHTYWFTPDTIIDGTKINEIKSRGWSRIPVFSKDLKKCHGVLLQKDLVDIDFDEDPVYISKFKLHPTKTVGSRTALDTMFRKFIGARSHLIVVEKKQVIVGIVTIENLIEEILGHEIEDETFHSLNN